MRTILGDLNSILAKLASIKGNRRTRSRVHHLGRRLRMEGLENRRMLTTYTVNYATDELDGIADGQISLRDAVAAAAASGDTIDFNPAHLNGNSIALTLGQIEIVGKSLTIDGGASGITINAYDPTSTQNNGDGSRIFNITGSSTNLVTLKNLTLTGGDVTGSGGAIYSTASLDIEDCTIEGNNVFGSMPIGGGIFAESSNGSINIQNSKIDGNYATTNTSSALSHGAGASLSAGTVTIADTSISHNDAVGLESNVGGLYIKAESNQSVMLIRVAINDNHAEDDVGGLAIENNGGNVTLIACSILRNIADHDDGDGFDPDDDICAGVYLQTAGGGSTTIENCLISENIVTGPNINGGGLYIRSDEDCTTTIRNSTISNNEANGNGGGIWITAGLSTTTTIQNCTISGNKAKGNGGGHILDWST
jgi:parallel beta-helix repeat protein